MVVLVLFSAWCLKQAYALFQITSVDQSNSDRFYRTLYAKLLSTDLLASSSKHELFLNLMYRSLKVCMFLPDSLLDFSRLAFPILAMWCLCVLFPLRLGLQHDVSLPRVRAMAKRLLQVSIHSTPAFAAGCLFLIAEVVKARADIVSLVTQPQPRLMESATAVTSPSTTSAASTEASGENEDTENGQENDEDKDEEMVESAEDSASEEVSSKRQQKAKPKANAAPSRPEPYNPMKREPLFSQADAACLWELVSIASNGALHSFSSLTSVRRFPWLFTSTHQCGNLPKPFCELPVAALLSVATLSKIFRCVGGTPLPMCPAPSSFSLLTAVGVFGQVCVPQSQNKAAHVCQGRYRRSPCGIWRR